MNIFETSNGDLRTRVVDYVSVVFPTLIIDEEVVLQSVQIINRGLDQEFGLRHEDSNLTLLVTFDSNGIKIGETKLNELNKMYYLPDMNNINFSGMIMKPVDDVHEIIKMWNESIYKVRNIKKLIEKI